MRAADLRLPLPARLPLPDPPPTSPEKGRPAPPRTPPDAWRLPSCLAAVAWRLWLWRRESAWEAPGAPFPVSVCVRLCGTGLGAPLRAKGPLNTLF